MGKDYSIAEKTIFQTAQSIEVLTGKLYSKMKNLVSLEEKRDFPKAYNKKKDSFS